MFSCSHQVPHSQPLSLGRCRPSRDGNRQPRPLKVEETRSPSRVYQAHTVPGSYRGGRGSQRNVAYLLPVSCWAKYRVRETLDMIMVLLLIFSADTAYQAREQGPFRRMIHPCLHPARRRELYSARQMCIAAAVYCSSCCCCAAATAASTATAERVRSKQRRFETGRVADNFFIHKTQLAKMSIDPKFVELTADVVRTILQKIKQKIGKVYPKLYFEIILFGVLQLTCSSQEGGTQSRAK